MKIVKPDHAGIKLAVNFLRAGKAVVFPTDTAYGLGVDATNARAVKRLFRIKKRRPQKPVHIVVASLAMAKKYAKFTPRAEKLFRKFLPGKLTLILPLTPALSRTGRGGSFRILSASTGTIGIRMPKNRVALELTKKLGRPITGTSANISSAPTAYSIAQIKRQFGKARLQPDLVLDSGKLEKVQPSTMVQLTAEGRVKIIRRGPISKNKILNALQL